MDQRGSERTWAGIVVGGLALGMAVVSGLAAAPDAPGWAMPTAAEHDGGGSGMTTLAEGKVDDSGNAWLRVPVCRTGNPEGPGPRLDDVRLAQARGVEVRAAFIDFQPSPHHARGTWTVAGNGIGWSSAEGMSVGSHVLADCDDDPARRFSSTYNELHVALHVDDLGSGQLAAFDGIEVGWEDDRRTGTLHLATAVGFCHEGQDVRECSRLLDAGEEPRSALHESWWHGDDPAATLPASQQVVLNGSHGPVAVPDLRSNGAGAQ